MVLPFQPTKTDLLNIGITRLPQSQRNLIAFVDKRRQTLAHGCGQLDRPPRRAIHIYMHEVALRGSHVIIVSKQRDLVAYAAPADARHAQANQDPVRESDLLKVAASRFHRETDHGAVLEIERAGIDQVAIDRRIKVAIVNGIVYVAVNIVIHPARLDLEEVREGRSRPWLRTCHVLAECGHQFQTTLGQLRSMRGDVIHKFLGVLRRDQQIAGAVIDLKSV